ncbi:glutamate racemase [Jeotgalicoccus halotolerans]|jgi:glutamate racemase|uniref:Glutamate racemase n=1 Tax=Jeotgalicoccus nanhaiensis TaxID=568603 RepID=A0ABR9XYC7_9STAP|nr:glutamate racemase [Jeotgalicoccus nanhaiensis]MBF0754004.1 glutamate racemase [Jeotgalicoccus nanhaiensis]TFU61491.1 glutamate racemase [Jeotgalicoccus nanhaiensis]
MNKPIGIMDSGVGGLTVMKEIIHALPSEEVYYFADSLHCPYGPKSQEDVKRYTAEAVEFLINKGVKAVIIACNTATAAVMPELRDEIDIPVYGVINPGSLGALRKSDNNEILLLATEGTIKSGAYEQGILSFDQDVKIHNLACPEFVTLIESLDYENPDITRRTVAEKLAPYREIKADTVILGCTHFPIIEKYIDEFFKGEKHIIDAGFETVSVALVQLHKKKLLTADNKSPVHKIFIHGENQRFEKVMNSWIPNIDYSIENILLQESY